VTWIETVGVHPYLCLGSDAGHVLVRIRSPGALVAASLVDAVVRVRGVAGTTKEPWFPLSVKTLLVPNASQVEVVKPQAADPFQGPVRPIKIVTQARPGKSATNRVRIQGYLTKQVVGTSLSLRDHTAVIDVLTSQPTRVPLGSPMDVSGFLVYHQERVCLSNAVFRLMQQTTSGTANAPEPIVPTVDRSAQPVLTHIDQIRQLSPAEAGRALPVRIQAVITIYRPEISMLFVQDGFSAIYVAVANLNLPLYRGQLIEVKGYTDPGLFAPIITRPTIRGLGDAPLPPTFLSNAEQLLTGERDAQLVEVRGFVRECRNSGNEGYLDLDDNGVRFTATVPEAIDPGAYTNRLVRIRGVAGGRFDDKRRITGIAIWMQSRRDIFVEQAIEQDPFASPHLRLGQIADYELTRRLNQHVKIQGTVVLQVANQYLLLLEDAQVITIYSDLAGRWQRGDRLEAAGFVGREGKRPVLRQGTFRKLESGTVPVPIRIAPDHVLDPTLENRWIQVVARLINCQQRAGETVLALEVAGWVFDAVCRNAVPEVLTRSLPPGSELQLAGVYRIRADPSLVPQTFSLEFESPRDIRMIHRPSWWTARRITGLLAVAVLVSLAALIWVRLLQRKVRMQTGQIRARLEKEAALERQYRDLVNNAQDPIFTLDNQGRFLSINPASQRILDYAPDEAARMRLIDIVSPAHRQRVGQMMEDRNHASGNGTWEMEVLSRGGTRVLLEFSSQRIQENGQPHGFQIIARDITERRKAELALRRSEQSLVLSQRIGKVGSWELDLDSQSLAWSEEAYRIFGCVPGGVQPTRQTFYDQVHAADRDAVRRAVADALNTGGTYSIDHRILLPDGTERWVHEQAEAIPYPDGRISKLAGTVQDITERRNLEEQLRHAQKMEAIGILAGGVAHDFNNILTVIHGHVELMQSRFGADPKLTGPLKEIAGAASRATNLTRQLLTFSRRQPIQSRTIDLNEVVENLTKLLRRLIGEHIQLHCSFVPLLPPIRADAGMIEQVIMNLAVNARDAMPEGGRLRIATTVAHLNTESASANPEARPGDFVVLSVSDTGTGMDEATLAHAFEPFFTTKKTGKGTGLGLATVYGIVKQHDGWITVASAVGKGSSFDVYLPVAPNNPTAEPKATSTLAPPRGSETILLVEDEEPLRGMMEELLTTLGYRVLKAANGPEALEVWAQHRDEIHLLLTDVVMPRGMTGLDLAQQMAAEKPSLRVIYTSGYSVQLAAQERYLHEGINFVQKPFQPHHVAKSIRNCLDHEPRVINPQAMDLKGSV
jgi:PAS domain S-box-containing protein